MELSRIRKRLDMRKEKTWGRTMLQEAEFAFVFWLFVHLIVGWRPPIEASWQIEPSDRQLECDRAEC